MNTNALNRFAHPEQNVGGGDLVTRIIATALLITLTLTVLPQLKVPYPLLKIALLAASELGLICVMLGMFFRAKTYFAGFQLFIASLTILALASRQVPYAGILVGFIFVAFGVQELVSKRSRLNALLGVSSFRLSAAGEVNLLDAALLPEPAAPPRRPTEMVAAPTPEGKVSS